ncbi:TetR/AcrR family transcriptional regulator [Pokkaliibacter sp. CJK22405]|uniref:TetR/AcrR family transcriptional regulator n=1 Tax=Pokkaliibacter sp. CJK22405 TaxID=3384615 RepID=UPI0039855618
MVSASDKSLTNDKSPTKEEKTEQRRLQILDAARLHVIEQGFHATSMAMVAKSSGLSVGQIYRYFENKEAIMGALVERITTRRLEWMDLSKSWLNPECADESSLAPARISDDDRAIMLEIQAEAARNPLIAEVSYQAHLRLEARAMSLLKTAYPEADEDYLRLISELRATLIQGMMLRRYDARDIDQNAMTRFCMKLLKRLLDEGNSAK